MALCIGCYGVARPQVESIASTRRKVLRSRPIRFNSLPPLENGRVNNIHRGAEHYSLGLTSNSRVVNRLQFARNTWASDDELRPILRSFPSSAWEHPHRSSASTGPE